MSPGAGGSTLAPPGRGGPIPLEGTPPSQRRITAQEAESNAVSFEEHSPEQADARLMMPEMGHGEKGRYNAYVDQELKRRNEQGGLLWQSKWAKEFDDNPQEALNSFVLSRTKKENDEEFASMQKSLNDLLGQIKAMDATADADLKQTINLGNQQASLDANSSAEMAKVYTQIAESKAQGNALKKEAIKIIEEALNEQVGVKQRLLKGATLDIVKMGTSDDPIDQAAYAHVKNWFIAGRKALDIGTIERTAELRVLTEMRDGAPYRVLTGRERTVMPAIKNWRDLNEQLKLTKDPKERADIEQKMRDQEQIVIDNCSSLNGTFFNRNEHNVIGLDQVKQSAWGQIRHTIDGLRDSAGHVKKAFVHTSANYSAASFETAAMKGEIFFQFGAAKNALKKLLRIGMANFVAEYADVPAPKQETENWKRFYDQARASTELTTEELKTAKDGLEAAKTARKTAEAREKVYDEQIKEYNAQVSAIPKKRTPDFKYLKGLLDEKNAANAAVMEADAKIVKLAAEVLRLEENDTLGKQQLDLAYDAKTHGIKQDDDLHNARVNAMKEKQYDDLVRKLGEFLNQTKLNLNFMDHFKPYEVRAIAKLVGLETLRDGSDQKEYLQCKFVVADEKPDDDGDYAFINLGAHPDFANRASSDAIDIIMAHPDQYPELAALLAKLQSQNKIVIVTGFPPLTVDSEGGVVEHKVSGSGQEFNQAAAERIKKAKNWSDAELFMEWLDDLNLQRELGARPEEIEERYATWIARNFQMQQKHFKGSDGWTLFNINVGSSAANFFDSTIRRMVDAGLELTSQSFRLLPFGQVLGRTGEPAITITDEQGRRKVLYRNQELSADVHAPKTVLARLYTSMGNRLALYYQRSMIGGESTSIAAAGMSGEETAKLGAYMQANLELLQIKMMELKAIYEHPGRTTEQRLEDLLNWRKVNMAHMTYEVIDANGKFVDKASNPMLWEAANNKLQWLGKLQRNWRESELRYAKTVRNPNATAEDIEDAETDYYENLSAMRNFEVEQQLLGMQAAGKLAGLNGKQLAKVIAGEHARIGAVAIRRMEERHMRTELGLDDDIDEGTTRKFVRWAGGKFARSRMADALRQTCHRWGIKLGDRKLLQVTRDFYEQRIKDKMDWDILERAAAHAAVGIRTGARWKGKKRRVGEGFFGSKQSALYDEDADAMPLELGEVGEWWHEGFLKRVKDDYEDEFSRHLELDTNDQIYVGKMQGFDIKRILSRAMGTRINNTQTVEDGEVRLWGKEGSRMSILELQFMRLLNRNLRRPFMGGRTPDDNEYEPFEQGQTPLARQWRQDQERAAAGRKRNDDHRARNAGRSPLDSDLN